MFWQVFLRRCGNVSLLLVLEGDLLEAVGDLLGAGVGAAVGALLLFGGAVDGLGLGFEAVDFGLSLGDVLEDMLVAGIEWTLRADVYEPPWSWRPGSPSSRQASP